MSKSKSKGSSVPNAASNTGTPVLSFTAESLRSLAVSRAEMYIAQLNELGTAESLSLAHAWGDNVRIHLREDMFDAAIIVAQSGIVAPAIVERACALTKPDSDERAPVKGIVKLRANFLALANNALPADFSMLHWGVCRVLTDSFIVNEDIHKLSSDFTKKSATGTMPTQRSSSAYALRTLGVIEEKGVRPGYMKWAQCEGANILRTLCANASRAELL